MKKPIYLLALFILLTVSIQPILAEENTTNATETKIKLEDLIDVKNKELQKIKEEMQAAKKNLDDTVTERKGLQTELHHIDKNIKTMELGIRAAQTEGQKLGLEIQSLSSEIKNINKMIDSKLKTLPEILRAYHEKSEINPLFVLLQKGTISEAFAEVESLNSIQAQLTTTINESRDLKNELEEKQDNVSAKRGEIELKKQDIAAKKAITKEEEERKQILLAETKNRESLYQKNYDDLAKKAMEFEAEIERTESALRKNIDLSKLPAPQSGLLQNPAPGAKLTQGYGRTNFAVKSYKSQWHNGVDLGDPIGTPLYAAEAGKIIATGNTDKYCPGQAYGKYVVIKHGNNLTTLYSHLSQYIVKDGQEVKRGELIGYIGKTGWATGPHVHFTIYASNTYETTRSKSCGSLPVGGDINPLDYISL